MFAFLERCPPCYQWESHHSESTINQIVLVVRAFHQLQQNTEFIGIKVFRRLHVMNQKSPTTT
jgi:hypothetical protein